MRIIKHQRTKLTCAHALVEYSYFKLGYEVEIFPNVDVRSGLEYVHIPQAATDNDTVTSHCS